MATKAAMKEAENIILKLLQVLELWKATRALIKDKIRSPGPLLGVRRLLS